MIYEKELVMPSSYAVLSEEEMTYVEGGSTRLKTIRSYLNKNTCLAEASHLIERQIVTGMSQLQIAKEIYAHAFVKYKYSALPNWVKNMSGMKDVYNRATYVDIDDGGDTAIRQAIYNTVWNFWLNNKN